MKPDAVDAAFKAVIRAVDNIDRVVDEQICDVLSELNLKDSEQSTYYKSIESQIFNLTHLGRSFSNKDVGSLIRSLEDTLVRLKSRVIQLEPVEREKIAPLILAQEELKALY